jgi:pilus assembly protein CpaF
VDEIGVVRRDGDLVGVLPAWRADGGALPGAARLAELLARPGGSTC